jgi:hypothetical protein
MSAVRESCGQKQGDPADLSDRTSVGARSTPATAPQNSGPSVGFQALPGMPTGMSDFCHTDSATTHDGLHLRSERTPREDFALDPLRLGEAIFRHSGWARQRQQTWECLQRLMPMSMACYRFSHCGSGAFIQLSAAGDAARCVCNCCHHRLCVPCQRAVGRVVQDNLTAHIKDKHCRFVTLTLRHSQTPLADQITRLFSSFSALRRRKDIAPLFVGGVSILEVKIGSKDGLWHPHLHILCEGSYVHARDLSSAWHAVTGDSSIVDIRQVDDSAKTAGYICKYVSKPIDATLYANATKLDEYVIAITGRKTMSTFGTWRGLKLKARPADTTVWHSFTSLLDFAARCRARDPHALHVLTLLRHQQEDATPPPGAAAGSSPPA